MRVLVRGRWVLSFLVATALVGAGCGGDDDAGSGGASDAAPKASASEETRSVELLLSFPLGAVWLPLIVAQEQGYFTEEKLNVKFQETEGTQYVIQQLTAGNADIGFASAGGATLAYAKDPSLRVLGCKEQRNIFSVEVPEDSPIKDISELAGKKIGIGDEGSGEGQMLKAIEKDFNLKMQYLPLGNNAPQLAVDALKNGKIAAFSAGYSPIALVEAAGVKLRDITPERYEPMPANCLLVRQSVLEDPDERAVAVKIVRSLSRGARFATANPDAALDLVCKGVPEQCQGEQRDSFAKVQVEQTIEHMQPIEGGPPLQVNPKGWDISADLLVSGGIIPEKPDMKAFTDSEEIRAVQEEAQDYDVQAVEDAAKNYKG
jgi:NitT/TauT family transport system substrate-binding protein